MPSKTLDELVEAIKSLSPEQRKERARAVAKARYKLERGRQKANPRKIPRDCSSIYIKGL